MQDAVATAVLGAVIAAVGYVGKLLIEALSAWRGRRAARLVRLLELASLLRAARATFIKQNELVKSLTDGLLHRFRPERPEAAGFEAVITHFYDRFDDQERETHQIIRSLTANALRPLNLALADWLRKDHYFRIARGSGALAKRLAQKLNQLDVHLTLWHAKYEAWMPDQRHALIYMADERDHGVMFPLGLDEAVEQMLNKHGIALVPHD